MGAHASAPRTGVPVRPYHHHLHALVFPLSSPLSRICALTPGSAPNADCENNEKLSHRLNQASFPERFRQPAKINKLG